MANSKLISSVSGFTSERAKECVVDGMSNSDGERPWIKRIADLVAQSDSPEAADVRKSLELLAESSLAESSTQLILHLEAIVKAICLFVQLQRLLEVQERFLQIADDAAIASRNMFSIVRYFLDHPEATQQISRMLHAGDDIEAWVKKKSEMLNSSCDALKLAGTRCAGRDLRGQIDEYIEELLPDAAITGDDPESVLYRVLRQVKLREGGVAADKAAEPGARLKAIWPDTSDYVAERWPSDDIVDDCIRQADALIAEAHNVIQTNSWIKDFARTLHIVQIHCGIPDIAKKES